MAMAKRRREVPLKCPWMDNLRLESAQGGDPKEAKIEARRPIHLKVLSLVLVPLNGDFIAVPVF